MNPILHGELAGFNRRRRYGRFNYGHNTIELDRLRFDHAFSEKDSDLCATEVLKTRGEKKTEKRKSNEGTKYATLCTFFQRERGCVLSGCRYTHKCAVCGKLNHGAVDCWARRHVDHSKDSTREVKNEPDKGRVDRPPNPRKRRARAQEE